MELEDNAIDVSEFFLIEYSADSETDSATDTASKSSLEPCDGLGDDDAESRTCDSSSIDCLGCDIAEEYACSSTRLNGTGCLNRQPELGDVGFVLEDEGGGGEEEEKEEAMWEEDDGGGLRKEEMDAMEDRLFWETCMAVGYPMN